MNYLGWLGNILLCIGFWTLGNKKRYAFIWMIVGELVWMTYAIHLNMTDLSLICFLFTIIDLRAWIKWK